MSAAGAPGTGGKPDKWTCKRCFAHPCPGTRDNGRSGWPLWDTQGSVAGGRATVVPSGGLSIGTLASAASRGRCRAPAQGRGPARKALPSGEEGTVPLGVGGRPSGWAGRGTPCPRGRCARGVWAARGGQRGGRARPRSPAAACGCAGRSPAGGPRGATAARAPRSPAAAGCGHKQRVSARPRGRPPAGPAPGLVSGGSRGEAWTHSPHTAPIGAGWGCRSRRFPEGEAEQGDGG